MHNGTYICGVYVSSTFTKVQHSDMIPLQSGSCLIVVQVHPTLVRLATGPIEPLEPDDGSLKLASPGSDEVMPHPA